MIAASLLNRRVVFQRRGPDEHGDLLGDWTDLADRRARIVPVRVGSAQSAETIVRQRLEGQQPVLIIVRRDQVTRTIDNADRGYDRHEVQARVDGGMTLAAAIAASAVWGVASAIWNERDDTMEILAVQRRGGSDA